MEWIAAIQQAITGMTANTYIRKRRLSLAGREIVETNAKITDIALKYGYETPESFTKAFTRFHGIAPKFAREESAKLILFNPLVIKIIVEGGKSMDYRIVKWLPKSHKENTTDWNDQKYAEIWRQGWAD